ncbi:MAG: protein kinase family protein [Oligoflexia bacterium]|nr:protein kinase family protein [Oligoflexia bacterium]
MKHLYRWLIFFILIIFYNHSAYSECSGGWKKLNPVKKNFFSIFNSPCSVDEDPIQKSSVINDNMMSGVVDAVNLLRNPTYDQLIPYFENLPKTIKCTEVESFVKQISERAAKVKKSLEKDPQNSSCHLDKSFYDKYKIEVTYNKEGGAYLNFGKMIGVGGFKKVYSGLKLLPEVEEYVNIQPKKQNNGESIFANEINNFHQITDTDDKKEGLALLDSVCKYTDKNVGESAWMPKYASDGLSGLRGKSKLGATISMLIPAFAKFFKKEEPFKKFIPKAKSLATGLKNMHSKNLFHGDIKLENMLVSKKGEIKLSDFDMGPYTPIYLPPDHLEKDFDMATHKQKKGRMADDIYSLGLSLYILKTGEVHKMQLAMLSYLQNLTPLEKQFKEAQNKYQKYLIKEEADKLKKESLENLNEIYKDEEKKVAKEKDPAKKKFNELILKMLNPKMGTRIDIDETIKELKKIDDISQKK